MFITHPPRQTRHKRLVGARTATPYAARQRTTDAPQGVLGGNGAIVAGTPHRPNDSLGGVGTVSRGGLRPKAEVLSVFRVTLFGA